LEDTKARAEVESLQGRCGRTAREDTGAGDQHGQERVSFPAKLEICRTSNPSVATVLAAQQRIFETRRQVIYIAGGRKSGKRSQR